MSTLFHSSVGIGNEATYKTYLAPTRHFEFNDESFNWDKETKQSAGLKTTRLTDAVDRRYVVSGQGSGDFSMDLVNKGMGLLWQAAMGTSTSTVIGATVAYQQVHTFGETLGSLTIQKGIPRITTATGAVAAVDPITFLGSVCTGFEINCPVDDIASAKFSYDVGDYSTAQSLATITYASTVSGFHGAQITTTSLGGTLTAATTTVVASVSGATTVGIRDFSLKVETPLDASRFNAGGSGRKAKPPVSGYRKVTGKVTLEYDSVTMRDNYLGDTTLPLLLTYTGAVIGATASNDTFQIVIPAAKLDEGMPMATKGDVVLVDHSFVALEPTSGTTGSLQLVQVTGDTAL